MVKLTWLFSLKGKFYSPRPHTGPSLIYKLEPVWPWTQPSFSVRRGPEEINAQSRKAHNITSVELRSEGTHPPPLEAARKQTTQGTQQVPMSICSLLLRATEFLLLTPELLEGKLREIKSLQNERILQNRLLWAEGNKKKEVTLD